MSTSPANVLTITPSATPDPVTVEILRSLIGTWVHAEYDNGATTDGTISQVQQREALGGAWCIYTEGWWMEVSKVTEVRWESPVARREARMPTIEFGDDCGYTTLLACMEGHDTTIHLASGEVFDCHRMESADARWLVVAPWDGERFDAAQARRIHLDTVVKVVLL